MADSPQAEQPAEQPAEADPSTPEADDELKDRFRAALERKRRTDAGQSAKGHGVGNNKVHEARRAGGKRTFRRKSG
ncbi:MAG TPA: DUF5302 domain-containing protein [Pseudonocardia sp.]